MTRAKKLFVLLGCLILLVLITGLVYGRKPTPASYTQLFNFETDQIEQLQITNTYGTISFFRQNGTWTSPDINEPLNTELLDHMVYKLAHISILKTLPVAENLSSYGLDNPLCTVYASGPSTSPEGLNLSIGVIGEMSGMRYISVGDSNIYLVDPLILEELSHSPEEYITPDSVNK